MTKVVLLDSGPLSILPNPSKKRHVIACRRWAEGLIKAGHRLIVPEITDYEVRRELLRLGKQSSIALLNRLHQDLEYLPISTWVMQRAAELWAFARQTGQPTAGDDTIDADMILIAQAESLGDPNAVIATSNVGHLARFFPAELWSNIAP